MRAGIDIGGTNLKVGITDDQGDLKAVRRAPLGNFQGAEALVRLLTAMLRETAEELGVAESELKSVGIGVPGAVEGGTVVYTCNVPMKNVPLAALVEKEVGIPVLLENDANCAAVGEYFCGAGRGTQNFATLTLGTGIGGGFVLAGKLYTGFGMVGEVGHMVVEKNGVLCNCGRRGCWEAYASASGLIRMTKETIKVNPDSLLAQKANDLGTISARTAFSAAEEGDPAAKKLCEDYLEYLAVGVTNLVNILQPEVLALGGGISNEREEALLMPLRERVARECYARHGGRMTKIVRAQLGNDAGLIGAALLPKIK